MNLLQLNTRQTLYGLFWLGALLWSCACVCTNSMAAQKSETILSILRTAPLWAEIAENKDAADNISRLNHTLSIISSYPEKELRTALYQYLTEVRHDRAKLSYRLDNARIICFLSFQPGIKHPYSGYFSICAGKVATLRQPTLLDNINRERIDGAAELKEFFGEFDKLARMKPREHLSTMDKTP